MSKKLIRSILWRALITFGIFAAYCLSIDIYHGVHLTTTQAFNGSLSSYVTAKFIREGGLPTYFFLIALFSFLVTWFSLILRIAYTPGQTNNQTPIGDKI